MTERINNKFNLNICAYQCDLFDKIQINRQFDYLFSDPVSTFERFQVFIGKVISMLREAGIGFISVSQRFSDVFHEYCEKSGIRCIETYKCFNNYYDSCYTVTSDKADLHKIQIEDKSKLTFSLLDTVDFNIFESQKDMKLFCRIEIFDIQSLMKKSKEN